MAPRRPSFPTPARASTPRRDMAEDPENIAPPATPSPIMDDTGDVIMGAHGVLVPPSPGFPNPLFDQTDPTPASPSLPIRKTKTHVLLQDRTGAGIKKAPVKSKGPIWKLVDATTNSAAVPSEQAVQQPFRFMHLPGEIRNLVYHHCFQKPKQALLVHRPRMASLRPRTRLDRQRTLESDIKDRELGFQLAVNKSRHSSKKEGKNETKRETNRPFWGLTQVSHQVRNEFRPIYLQKQELGMDLTEIVQYLQTFYPDAPAEFAKLNTGGVRGKDLPFNGNLTIAVGDKPIDLEHSANGVEVIPLLDLWSNSFKIEAGFGRYLKANYIPQSDGEAKDLYRLFGRRVLKNRQCSSMNGLWRSILRTRALASVTLHRKPASRIVDLASFLPGTLPGPVTAHLIPGRITLETKPYIHVLFRAEFAEPWMTQLVSDIPKAPVDWLAERGFGGMEHFDVRVGVAPAGMDRRM